MRRLLIFSFLLLATFPVQGQPLMFEEGKEWCYDFMYNFDEAWLPAGEAFASEQWSVGGTEECNGRIYRNLIRESYFVGVKANISEMWRPSFIDDENRNKVWGEVMLVREEGGKVYAVKEKYLSLLKSLYPSDIHPQINPDSFYVAPAEDDTEILLYDFTLKEGDLYPCVGNPIVQEVSHYTTHDGYTRKLLRLSNGAILMEGIGCVNSIGGIVIYQNMNDIVERFTAGRMIYAQLFSCKASSEGEQFFLRSEDGGIFSGVSHLIHDSDSSHVSIYELSGRRLITRPTRSGIYIHRGKKLLIR